MFNRDRKELDDGIPHSLHYRLIGNHSLWGHVTCKISSDIHQSMDHISLEGNAGLWMARYIDENPEIVYQKTVLELGAGAALPSLISAFNEAKYVLATDYPDSDLISILNENIGHNRAKCTSFKACIESAGFMWGSNIDQLISKCKQGFDVIIMCDIVFNHSQHRNILKSCVECLAPGGTILCSFTHHRPW